MELRSGFAKDSLYGRDGIFLKGGQIMLICSTLSSLPIYFMFLFTVPRPIRMRLEKIQRTFFGEEEP